MESNLGLEVDSDGLYPEWDEFCLLVCDICGIIIMPQYLEKHLATKHRINAQHNQVEPPLPENHKTSIITHNNNNNNNDTERPNDISRSDDHNINHSINAGTNTNRNNVINNNSIDPIFYDLEPLSPTATSTSKSSSSAASTLSSTSSSGLSLPNGHPPSLSISSKYQDRKWRNTFNVLRDAFF